MKRYMTGLMAGLLLVLGSCSKPREVTTAFYLWKSVWTPQDLDTAYLKKLNTKKLYVRFFDIDDQGKGPVPVGTIALENPKLPGLPVVPVVFITNRTFLNRTPEALDLLAERTVAKITALSETLSLAKPVEYQFDCDWTAGTKAAYFSFLDKVRQRQPGIRLSCTIRLHQVKYVLKMGVPPVDKGVLMYYASTEPTDFKARNSILENTEAAKYIGTMKDYPKPLDIALPLFSWAIVQNPFGKIKLINGVRNAELQNNPDLYEPEEKNFYRVLKPHYLKGMWLNAGFMIKVEEVEQSTLQKAAQMLKAQLNQESTEIIFYHLDHDLQQRYPADIVQQLLNTFAS